MSRFPAVFVSHGAPTLALEDIEANRFLRGLGDQLGQPRAIVVASAHWLTAAPAVCATAQPATIHDFSGFPPALYEISYPAPGNSELAHRIADLLAAAGLQSTLDTQWGLDHGAWVPLMLMYPGANIPVLQIALQPQLGTRHHFNLGRALAPLREEGVLILASGGATHNLGELSAPGTPPPSWATDFSRWLYDTLAAGNSEALLDYRRLAPQAVRNHPSEEHFLPLLVAAGAGLTPQGRRLHTSNSYGSLMMDAYAFD